MRVISAGTSSLVPPGSGLAVAAEDNPLQAKYYVKRKAWPGHLDSDVSVLQVSSLTCMVWWCLVCARLRVNSLLLPNGRGACLALPADQPSLLKEKWQGRDAHSTFGRGLALFKKLLPPDNLLPPSNYMMRKVLGYVNPFTDFLMLLHLLRQMSTNT